MDEYARLAAEGMELDGHGRGRPDRATAQTRSRLFSIAPHLAADLDEAGIAKLVRVPTARHFLLSALTEARNMARSHPVLILVVVIASIGLISGIIAALTILAQVGACSAIVAHHSERTVRVQPIGGGLDLDAEIFIDNRWPRGSVEIVADKYDPVGAFEVRRVNLCFVYLKIHLISAFLVPGEQFYVELTSFAPNDALLLSAEALQGAVQFSDLVPPSSGTDDTYGGYASLSVVLTPPECELDSIDAWRSGAPHFLVHIVSWVFAAALTDCTMLRVRIHARNTIAAYTVRTTDAFVNFTGACAAPCPDSDVSYLHHPSMLCRQLRPGAQRP